MSDFQQTQFLGSSVMSFNGTHAHGGGPSTVTVNLVDDDKVGDSFSAPGVGSPVTFTFGNFTFRGLLQNYEGKAGPGGNPVYSAVIVSPDDLANAVQLITNGYSGATSAVPNCYNVYGFLENTGFGNALVNDAGMKWATCVNALSALVAGSPIVFRGYAYTLDLSALPLLPADYRVGGSGHLSLGELVADICDAASHDFYWVLDPGQVIRLATINRANQPNFGLITNFVNSTSGAIEKNLGRDLRNEVTSRFVVGGNVQRVWYVGRTDTSVSAANATIWPFWGFDINGKPIIGQNWDDDHNFKVDARALNIAEIGDEYHMDVAELRAALDSVESWEVFLWIHNDENGSIHFKKADRLKIGSSSTREIKGLFTGADLDELKKLTPKDIAAAREKDVTKPTPSDIEERNLLLYQAIKAFADEFYGRRFMVRLPNIFVKRVPDTNNIIFSDEPVDSGFIDESTWPNAIGNNFLPLDVDRLLDSEGKVVAYIRMNNGSLYDFSAFSQDDYIVSGNSVFIKVAVEEGVIFRDPVNLLDPRAVITLPAPVFLKQNGLHIGALLRELFTDAITAAGGSASDIAEIVTNFWKSGGGEVGFISVSPAAVLPDLAAVPLLSNVLTYGPWYAVGADGKTEYEQDTSLTPWNFGGWTQMNAAGTAKVLQALSNNQIEESGTVVVPGGPDRNLGDQIMTGGPYITDINVVVDPQQGVVTTYHMKTWSPRVDRLAAAAADRIRRLGKTGQEQRKMLRQMRKQAARLRTAPKSGGASLSGGITPPKASLRAGRLVAKSSGQLIIADVIDTDDSPPKHNVVVAPIHDIATKLDEDGWRRKAVMSLEGLIRPFGINESSSYSNFETPSGGAAAPTSVELNPFKSGHDISLLTQGEEVPTNGLSVSSDYQNVIRGIALRGPLVLSGWGYDTNSKPVPNSNPASPTSSFAAGYLSNPSTWKTGPVDLRWDDSKKIWTTTPGIKYGRFVLASDWRYDSDSGIASFLYGSDGSTLLNQILYKQDDGIIARTNDIWGKTGAKGQAIFSTSHGRWFAIQLDRPALFISFTLASTLNTANASGTANVDDHWCGDTVPMASRPFGPDIDILNTNNMYSGLTGWKGIASWNERADYYTITYLEHQR